MKSKLNVKAECHECGCVVNNHPIYGDSCYTVEGWGPYCETCRDEIDAQIVDDMVEATSEFLEECEDPSWGIV